MLKNMRKRICIFISMVFLVTTLAACGGTNDDVKCLDIVNSCKNVVEDGTFDTSSGYGEDLYDGNFDTLYGVQFDMIDDGAISYTSEGGVADEISIIHLKKSEDVSLAKTKMQDRITERTNTFSQYKPEESYKLENAIVMAQGNYVALIVSEQPDVIETEIRRVISEGVK